MKRVMQAKNKVTLLLLSAILLLCIAFVFTACGVGPTTKADNPNRGNFAVDFTDCPAGYICALSASATVQSYSTNSIETKPLTIEAWIKPKSTSTLYFLKHMEARGVALKTAGIDLSPAPANTTQVTPIFEIRRVVITAGGGGATSTVSYTVSGTVINLNVWNHVAGKLTNDTHAIGMMINGTAHPTCSAAVGDGDATDDPWHLDIYLGNKSTPPTIVACAPTYGGTASDTFADPTAAAVAFAHEQGGDDPGDKIISIAALSIVEETRIWTNDDRNLFTCYKQELNIGGVCDYTDPALLSYMRFNAGDGHYVADEAGVFGTAGKEYPLGNSLFGKWNTGWTTDTPF